MRRLLLAASLVVASASVHAQPDPMKWGDIPDEHLMMTDYPADPDAHAVILGDYGDARLESDWSITYDRHRRIKILDEGGYDYADVTLTYLHEDRYQRISKIQGQTFVRESDGRTRRVKLDKKSIFTEDLEGGRKRIKFTLPALEPGAVVEFRYRIKTESPLQLPRWYFQDEEPVLHSEFRLEHPNTLAYSVVTQGNPEFAVRTQEEGVRADGSVQIYRWVANDVPALREERYMTTLQDYIQKIDIQLVEYYRAGMGAVRVIKTWEQLAEDLNQNTDFGGKLKIGGDVKREAERLVAGLSTPAEKARAIYDYVRNTVVWDENYRLFADERLDHVLRDKRGSSAEINLLLVAMLREAGVPAAPAMLSTRGHGRIIRIYPLVSQFNYTVAAVRQGGRWHLLDATDPFRPYGMLPVRALNETVLVIAEGPEWVTVGVGGSEHAVALEATLEPDGTLAGTLRSVKTGYAGIRARRAVRDDGAEAYVSDDLLDDVAGAEVESVTVSGQEETELPLVTEVAFRIPDYAQSVGDLVLLNPVVVLRHEEAPFTLERRTYPVDFAYPSSTSYSATITLPEGYVADEVPEKALLLLPVRGGGYERSVEIDGNVIRAETAFRLRKTLFEPNVYTDVKTLFDRAVAADAETVVLMKREAGPAGEEAEADTKADALPVERN